MFVLNTNHIEKYVRQCSQSLTKWLCNVMNISHTATYF
jgi:hypothetical protein